MRQFTHRLPDDFHERLEAYRRERGLASLNKAMDDALVRATEYVEALSSAEDRRFD